MGLSDIPNSFGLSFFFRTFFPASIATILYGIAFYPFIMTSFWFKLTFENKIFVWIAVSLLIGILLNLLDLYIYQFYEGLRFWHNRLKNYFYSKQIEKFNKIDNELKNVHNEIKKEVDPLKKRELYEKASRLWAEVRKYPYNPDYNSHTGRYPENPTEFGNVLAEYELYSERQYGMHMMVFWQHLWFILPKDVKGDLELRSAKADFSVYISFLLLIYIFIGTIGFAFWSKVLAAVFLIISALFWYISYKIATLEHKAYGRYIKAIFDLYRFDLANKLNIVIGKDLIEERKSWIKWRHYFLDYRIPEK